MSHIEKKSDEEIARIEEDMDVVHASETEVIAKPKGVKKMVNKKAEAKKLSKEEKEKLIDENTIGEFDE